MQVKGSKSQTVDGSTDTIDNAAVPVVETPSIVQPPDTAFARSLVEAGGYGQRRRTKQGAPIDRWPMMAYHQTAANPSTRSAQETKKVDVGGQVAWSHDPGHVYGSYHTFDALHFDGWPDRKVHVLLPRGWDDGERNFPVVFMNDGQNAFFESDGGRSWFVADQLASMNGRTRDVIVVGLEALNRAPEYTYIKRPAGVLRVQDYTKYLADHVKPFIDANYPTVSNDATIVGSSHGGLAAFFIATRRPDAFGKAICMSSSFWHGLDKGARGGPLRDSNLITPIVETLSDPKVRPSLWIDWGLVRDGGPHNADIEALATKRGEEMVDLLGATFGYDQGHDLFAFEDPEGRHDETSWGRRFIGAMDAFYGRST